MERAVVLDPAFVRAVDHFNRGQYFDAHEAWEEGWTSNFEKGLIQAAAALLHFERGNLHGARRLYAGSRGYLEPYRPRFQGIELEPFVAGMERCFAELLSTVEGSGSNIGFEKKLVPRIDVPVQL